jgi:hypothetical protein
MKRKRDEDPESKVEPRLIDDRRWLSERRIGQRRLLELPFEEERRSGEDRRDGKERRSTKERRRANRRCEFQPDGSEPCRQLGVMLDPATQEWRCMEHLEGSPDTP